MTTIILLGVKAKPYWYSDDDKRLKPDRNGQLGGYRLNPSGSNLAKDSIFLRDIDEVARYLKSNPSWGLRFKTEDGQVNLFYKDILINGLPR